jgi:PAS domain S-box-containing protein
VHEHLNTLDASDRTAHQLALLIEGVTDYAIFLLDVDGHILTWNPGAQRAKGYTRDEIVGRHFSTFYTEEDLERDHPAEALETARREGRFAEEGWRRRKDGSRFWASVVITAIREEDGTLLGFGKVTRDLTERRAMEVQLESFAATAAHDLQEPLRTVQGYADLLLGHRGADLPEETLGHLGQISAGVERMKRLITGLLAYSRAGSGQLELGPVGLAEVLAGALERLAGQVAERGTKVRAEVPAEAVVPADRPALGLVFQNLVSNALKFADAERPDVAVTAEREGDRWRVTVSDNGPGIPADRREWIFEPFTQLRGGDESGSGLGLSICRRIVERHGGELGVEFPPGRGTCFWFALPAAP